MTTSTLPSVVDTLKEIPQLPADIDPADKELIVKAKMTDVMDDASLILAGDIYTKLAARKKEFTRQLSSFDEKKKAVKAALDSVFNSFKKILIEPFEEAMNPLGGKIATYNEKKEQERQAEERRIQELARKQAEDEQLAAAAAAEKSGQHEEAQAIIEEAPIIPTVVIPKSTPKLAGIAGKTNWVISSVDVKRFWEAASIDNRLRSFFIVDFSALKKEAERFQKEGEIYPGVLVHKESGIRSTGR